MNLSGDFIVNLLFQTHANMTINNPLTLNKFTGKYSKLKPKLLENINKTIEDKCDNVYFNTLFEECYREFKELNNPYGSVDCNPEFWFSIFKASFYNTKDIQKFSLNELDNYSEDSEYTINVPNGCCTQEICYITVFYGIINKHIQN